MSLPMAWVDKIFHKLTLIYGRDFIGRWEGLSLIDVKTDWGNELAGFENWPEAISHALANLPPAKPPTALEFRYLARKAQRKDVLALPSVKANPARMEAELRKLAALKAVASEVRVGHKAWARRLVDLEKSGKRLTPTVSRMAREALAGAA